MKFTRITRSQMHLWESMRRGLYSEFIDEYEAQEMKQILDSELWHCWFVEEENEIIGMVELSLRNIADGCLSSPVPYLEGLYLLPEFRNKGVGKQLIEAIKTWCKSNGYSELATDAELENSAAHRFYLANGFEEVDRVVEFRCNLANSAESES